MKYSSRYFNESADEIWIAASEINRRMEFIKNHKDKRYIIETSNDKYFNDDYFDDILKLANADIKLAVALGQSSSFDKFKAANIDVFFNLPISDWSLATRAIEYGCSDIILIEPLCFDLETIRKLPPCNIRVCPNQQSGIFEELKPHYFFIFPEDVKYYEDVFTVFDFKAETQQKEEVLIRRYKENSFPFAAGVLLPSLSMDVYRAMLPREFIHHRLTCKQACLMPGNGCTICDTCFRVAAKAKNLMQGEKENGD